MIVEDMGRILISPCIVQVSDLGSVKSQASLLSEAALLPEA